MKRGQTLVRDLDVAPVRHAVVSDAAGLLPAAIFHRIYISHSGGFVVLNPGEKQKLRHEPIEIAALCTP